jgi:hypothetical protein
MIGSGSRGGGDHDIGPPGPPGSIEADRLAAQVRRGRAARLTLRLAMTIDHRFGEVASGSGAVARADEEQIAVPEVGEDLLREAERGVADRHRPRRSGSRSAPLAGRKAAAKSGEAPGGALSRATASGLDLAEDLDLAHHQRVDPAATRRGARPRPGRT